MSRASKATTCQYPVTLARGVADTCGKPAEWETDDLKAVHHLCDEHCNEALRWNDFIADPVGS